MNIRIGSIRELRSDYLALRPAQFYVHSIVDQIDVGNTQIRIRDAIKAREHTVGRFDAAPGVPLPNFEGNGAPHWISITNMFRRLHYYRTDIRRRAPPANAQGRIHLYGD